MRARSREPQVRIRATSSPAFPAPQPSSRARRRTTRRAKRAGRPFRPRTIRVPGIFGKVGARILPGLGALVAAYEIGKGIADAVEQYQLEQMEKALGPAISPIRPRVKRSDAGQPGRASAPSSQPAPQVQPVPAPRPSPAPAARPQNAPNPMTNPAPAPQIRAQPAPKPAQNPAKPATVSRPAGRKIPRKLPKIPPILLPFLPNFLQPIQRFAPPPSPAPRPRSPGLGLTPFETPGVESAPEARPRRDRCEDQRTRRKPDCRQGYFTESRDGVVRYTKWSNRRCGPEDVFARREFERNKARAKRARAIAKEERRELAASRKEAKRLATQQLFSLGA